MKPIFDKFIDTLPGVDIGYEILPQRDPDTYTQMQQRINTEIMGGSGPDLFILHSGYYTRGTPNLNCFFTDINKVMRSGIFTDLSPLFVDGSLSKDDFVPVLDVGAVDGKQFVMPLMYQVSGIVTNADSYIKFGLGDFADTGAMLNAIATATTAANSGAWSASSSSNIYELISPYFFSNLVDYSNETESVGSDITRQVLSSAKTAYQNVEDRRIFENNTNISDSYLEYANSGDFLVFATNFVDIVGEAAVAQHAGATPHIRILRADGGGVRAVITMFAAVRSGSGMEDAAKALVAYLLSTESQTSFNPQMGPQWWDGFPMRKGLVEQRVNLVTGRNFQVGQAFPRLSIENAQALIDVENQVASACFPVPLEVTDMIAFFYRGDSSIDECIRQMQSYWQQSLTE